MLQRLLGIQRAGWPHGPGNKGEDPRRLEQSQEPNTEQIHNLAFPSTNVSGIFRNLCGPRSAAYTVLPVATSPLVSRFRQVYTKASLQFGLVLRVLEVFQPRDYHDGHKDFRLDLG
jgi:hypothetical protein